MSDIETAFWANHDQPSNSACQETVIHYVRLALEFMQDEGHDPLVDARIENAVRAMVDTQPSWGARLARVWSALGHDFGGADSLDWGLQRDFIRLFGYHAGARQAIAERRQDYPPLGEVVR